MAPESLRSFLEAAMPRHLELARQTRVEHDASLEAMLELESALGSAAPEQERAWNQKVLHKLTAVADRLAAHARSADGPGGVLSGIDATSPTSLHRVEQLRQEHAGMLQRARALQEQVAREGEVPDFRDVRQRTTALLNALRHHQDAETDLIFESLFTDLGTGD